MKNIAAFAQQTNVAVIAIMLSMAVMITIAAMPNVAALLTIVALQDIGNYGSSYTANYHCIVNCS